jgi:hypothetical protein
MHFRNLPVALLALATAALGACDSLPSDPGVPGQAAPSASVGAGAGEPDALRVDAESYAARFGVDVDEALRRLRLQEAVGELNARLQAEHPETFAGLTIEHQPQFAVVARFTRGGDAALRNAVRDPALAGAVRHEHAPVPLRRLQTRLEAAYGRVRGRGVHAAGGLNLRANRPEIYVPAAAVAAARAAVPVETGAVVVPVDRLPEPEVLYGGLNLSTCTSGFHVRNGTGTPGISTAGHCGNSQSQSFWTLTFLGESLTGSFDIQWHNLPGATTYSNLIQVGSGTRAITSTRARASQSSGEWICKQGMTTGNTCGTLNTTSYCWTGACTYVYVDGGSVNLSEGGDSGGPWFSGNTAYGSHVLGAGNDSGYMAVDYFSGIGVTIVTQTPLSVTLSGKQNIARYESAMYTATPAGGTAPYTYEWRSRDGLNGGFGAWNGWWSGGSSNTTYASINSCGLNQKQLEVRVTDAAAQTANATFTIYITNPC